MKRALLVALHAIILSIVPTLAAPPAENPSRTGVEAPKAATRIVGVDYVLALMDEGLDPKEIVDRIREKELSFRLRPGDIERLRAAGAPQDLIDAVTDASVVLENREGADSGAVRPRPGTGADTNGWGRPQRLGSSSQGGTVQAPDDSSVGRDDVDENGEGIEEEPYDGYGAAAYGDIYYPQPYYGYSYYSFGYPYPYYYYPGYYYPYRYYSYYGPYSYHSPRTTYRTVPRGGGSGGHAPRGGSPRSTPRGGGAPRSTPRGSHH